MAHIVIGLPEIEQLHLHSRLARRLAARGHRVSVWPGDPVTFEVYSHQGLACRELRPATPKAAGLVAPVAEFAEIDARLAGRPAGSAAVERALARAAAGLARLIETDPPDLTLVFAGRSGRHRLLHFLSVGHGIRVLHVGPGLLPSTLQVDAQGVDGDASFGQAGPQDYRSAAVDDALLDAATAAWLGHALPPPLPRLGFSVPPLGDRVFAALRAFGRGQWRLATQGLNAWERAHRLPRLPDPPPAMPPAPFGVVLLQPDADPRLRLDCSTPVDPRALVEHTRDALRRLDRGIGTAVAAPGGRPLGRGWPDGVEWLPENAASVATATALVVTSINHPLGFGGLLAGTPVLHLGRTPYGVDGVACASNLDTLALDLERAVTCPHAPLRRRFLTRMLEQHHIWCSATQPDGNGLAGIVQHLERALGGPAPKLQYRHGPAWPLAAGDSYKS